MTTPYCISHEIFRVKGLFLLTFLLLVGYNIAIQSDVKGGGDERTTPPLCGSSNPNQNEIDLSEPDEPGPFHDLTYHELVQLREFLEQDPNIRAVSPNRASLNSSYIHAADLLVPPKAETLDYLANPEEVPKPTRRARVVVFRGDKSPPVVEEYVCSPLPDIQECKLLKLASRRNPIEYTFRPPSELDYAAFSDYILPLVDKEVGYILEKSYGQTFTNCEDRSDCLTYYPSPVGSGLTQEPNRRVTWLNACYDIAYVTLHQLDFAVMVDNSDPNPSKWTVVKIWYAGRIFEDFHSLVHSYNSSAIKKTRFTKPPDTEDLFSSMHQHGEFSPPKPQRPPTIVEPDGKRYSLKDKQVQYLGWSFHIRNSQFTGPAVYDVRYKGQRIAYELSLNEIGVFYSGHSPFGQTTNYVDSGELMGSWSRALVPGGDCPDTATLIPSTFISEEEVQPRTYKASFCLFELNSGYPLRRHLSYDFDSGSFYSGLMDTVLTLRAGLVIGNYDYLVDFMFRQNGVVEARLMSTGFIQPVVFTKSEKIFGFQLQDRLLGNVHHHLAHFKVDMDVEGTSNRFETLDIVQESSHLTAFPDQPYSQTRYRRSLKKTESEAVYDFDLKKPKYLVVHNSEVGTDHGEIKGYRIQLNGMSKNLVKEGQGNERTMPWGRHQMVVTKYKDDEVSSSSIYGMYDSFNPVVDFSTFYADNETIVDQDLVAWITCGMHHIPHTEDLPVTPTVGNHLSFFLLPYNFFPVCPSMGSRDAIYVKHLDPHNPHLGVRVERYGNSREQCVMPSPTLEEDLYEDPDRLLESQHEHATPKQGASWRK